MSDKVSLEDINDITQLKAYAFDYKMRIEQEQQELYAIMQKIQVLSSKEDEDGTAYS